MDGSNDAVDSLAGWLVVAPSLLVLATVWGGIFTFTVYADALGSAFDLTAIQVSSVFSFTTAAFLVAGGLIGILIARMPLRPVVVGAAAGIGVAVVSLQFVTSYVGLVAAFGLLGATGGTMFIVVLSLVPQWFDEYEGRAMGITMTGNGLGVLLMPFVWVWLLAQTDVRGAFAVVGGGMVVAVLLAGLVYRWPPGLRPDASGGIDLSRLRTMVSATSYRVAVVGFALLWAWYFVLSAGMVDLLTTAGIDRTTAATAFGTIGGISIVARLGSGWVADRVGARETFTGGVVLASLGLVILTGVETPRSMYATLVVFGAGLGVIATLFSPVVIRQFGPEDATAIVGTFNSVEAVAAFLAPIAMNVAVAATGSYSIPLVILATVTLLGAGMFYWGTDPRRAPAG